MSSLLPLSDIEIVRTIGVGSFSHVELAYILALKKYCALKIVCRSRIAELHQRDPVQSKLNFLNQK
jgi:serine/threonine protein kinase